jgi:hypothetical protein
MNRLAVIAAVGLVSTGLLPSVGKRAPLLFGEGDHWIVVDPRSYQAAPVVFPISEIENAAASPDATSFAVIAHDAKRGSAVWLWSRGQESARLLFAKDGHFADPAFGADGKWLYFSHSGSGVRPHMAGNYAQIFRSRPDGSSLEQITDEDGCHFGTTIARGDLHYIHSSCSTTSWLRRQGADGKTATEATTLGIIDEVAVSPSGNVILYVLNGPDSVTVWRLRLGRPAQVLFRDRKTMQRLRPAFGRDEDEILFQASGAVWLLANHNKRPIATISAARGSRT